MALAEDAVSLGAELAGDTTAPVSLSGVPWLGNELRDYLAEQLGEPQRQPQILRAS